MPLWFSPAPTVGIMFKNSSEICRHYSQDWDNVSDDTSVVEQDYEVCYHSLNCVSAVDILVAHQCDCIYNYLYDIFIN